MVDIKEKLEILSDAAKYDVSCSSSGSNRKSSKGSLGDASACGICHSFTPDGRCISLLKILLTNYCIYDCAYCINRKSNDVRRAAFTVDEVVDLTINFYRRNYIEGLFLSSAIIKNPNHTMEMLTNVVERLRLREGFNGYIHLKAIPGADDALVKRAGSFVDRMSVNVELPSNDSLKLLAPDKESKNIFTPMSLISKSIIQNNDDRKIFRKAPLFVPGVTQPPTLREHRLYQADWLLRLYGFNVNEILNDKNPNLDVNVDPKCLWALNNLDKFPIEINKASYETLIRIPGIGFRGARKIISARRLGPLTFEDLRKMNITLKRAVYFITCSGRYYGDIKFREDTLYRALSPNIDLSADSEKPFEQLSFFSQTVLTSITSTKITGEM